MIVVPPLFLPLDQHQAGLEGLWRLHAAMLHFCDRVLNNVAHLRDKI